MAVLFPYPLFGIAFASMLPMERLVSWDRRGEGMPSPRRSADIDGVDTSDNPVVDDAVRSVSRRLHMRARRHSAR
jgi:hypothetical protein